MRVLCAGPVLVLAAAAGILVGVRLQPRAGTALERAKERVPMVQAADVL